MSFPAVIHSEVDPAAVTKVTRLFKNTIGDVLCELIQNSRRAGATQVDLTVLTIHDQPYLSVADDGAGIADPSVVLALGRSGWDSATVTREDPAGMGVFSLAGRNVVIRSRSHPSPSGWAISIPAPAWEDGRPIPVEVCDRPIGTEIIVPLDPIWASALVGAARGAAVHCPIPVAFNGQQLERRDWLHGAKAIFEEDGVRIGVFDDYRANIYTATINFHGVTVTGSLPVITEKQRHWSVRVDIVDAPELQLVLPARKEMVENLALARLREASRRAIYKHIATLPGHRLAYDAWSEAAKLGVALPEAEARLSEWGPATADRDTGITRSEIPADGLIIVEQFDASLEQSAYFALARDGRFAGRLADGDDTMAGYGWYDRLARITAIAFEIEQGGEILSYTEAGQPGCDTGTVDRLDLTLILTGWETDSIVMPAPILIAYDDGSCWNCEEAIILFTDPETITPDDLTDLLERVCFSSSDDRDADSWDTQHDRFLLDAREMATSILLGEDAALIERLRAVLAQRVQWFVPQGRTFHIEIGRSAIAIRLGTEGSAPCEA